MTKEEAKKILDPETSRDALLGYEDEDRIEVVNEACRIAVAALRAQQAKLDRSWWGGCETCKGGRYRRGEYCPGCGRPLTEEAWAEMERRINGGTID